MSHLCGKHISLRALEKEDLDFLYKVENDDALWEVSGTQIPFSKTLLKDYLSNAHRDIYEVKQLRLVICKADHLPLGFIDIFDFDIQHRRAGIGIVIAQQEERRKGYGKEALQLLCDYCFLHLNLHQVYANVLEENTASQYLFEGMGFEKTGLKKDWCFSQGHYKNELTYQLISPNVL